MSRRFNVSDDAKTYSTWLIKPNHEWLSWMSVGIGKLAMASMNFWWGLTWSIVISNPAKVTVFCPNWNLLGQKVMPLRKSSQSSAWKNCSANHQTKRENHLHILSCFVYLILFHQSYGSSHPLRRCSPMVQLYNDNIPMVWWKWWDVGHLHEGEYHDNYFNSQKQFSFCCLVQRELDETGIWCDGFPLLH